MIALPVMAIAACSSNKNASNDQSGEGMLGAGTGMDANGNGGNMSFEEQARLPDAAAATEQHRLLRSGQSTISVLTSRYAGRACELPAQQPVLQSDCRRSRG